jgi:hypothetical protein
MGRSSIVYVIYDPEQLGWKPVVKVEHSQIGPDVIDSANNAE